MLIVIKSDEEKAKEVLARINMRSFRYSHQALQPSGTLECLKEDVDLVVEGMAVVLTLALRNKAE